MASLEAENIWEVGSSGSACSLDDELSQELEELERLEEQQRTTATTNHQTDTNGTVELTSVECTNGASSGREEDSDCIIFKDTGVINVADCNEVSDAYKGKLPNKRFGLSGMAASIARRERKRLQYHKKKLDPTFAMRRSEYRRKYREKVKIRAQLIAKRAAAKVSDSSYGTRPQQMVFFPELDAFPQKSQQLSANTAKQKHRPKPKVKPFLLAHRKYYAADGESKIVTKSVARVAANIADTDEDADYSSDLSGGYHSSATALSHQSKKSAAGMAQTLQAMKMRFCPKNVTIDDGKVPPVIKSRNIAKGNVHNGGKVSSHTGNGTGSPTKGSIPGQFSNDLSSYAYDHAQDIIGKLKMVSLKRYRHMQLVNKRLSSKMAYYQTVIRRDRAVIELLRSELSTLGRSVDCTHLKIPNFRLKYLNNPLDNVITGIDSQELEAYTRLLSGHKVECVAVKTQEKMENVAREVVNSPIQLSDNCTSDYAQNQLSSEIIKKSKSELNKRPFITLEKALLSTPNLSSISSESSKKKKQVAMKSSRGAFKIKIDGFKKSSASKMNDSLRVIDDKSIAIHKAKEICSSSMADMLQEKAIREGLAFAQLKAKCSIPKVEKKYKPGPKSSKIQRVNITNEERKDLKVNIKFSNIFPIANSGSPRDLYSGKFKKKKNNYMKKTKKELQDDVYVPDVPIDMSDTLTSADVERDNDLFDLVSQYRDEDEVSSMGGVCDSSSITANLRRLVLHFVAETSAHDRSVHGFSDSTSEDGSIGEVDMDSEKGGGGNKRVSGYDSQSESSIASSYSTTNRDQFIGLLHKRFLATHRQSCSLKIFSECLSSTMVKRPAVTRGYSNCLVCGLPELRFESLVNHGVLDFKSDFENILIDKELKAIMYASLEKIKDKTTSIPYLTFVKNNKGNYAKSLKATTENVSSIVKNLKRDMLSLEPHLEDITGKYNVIRAALTRCVENSNEVLVHITWGENPKVYHRSINNQTIADQCVSLLCGYVWTGAREYSFACLSDMRDHSTSALWAHLEDPLRDLVQEGFKRFYIVSDPTVSQFRNKMQFYYMNEFAVKQSVEIRWIYTAGYHTHLHGDISSLRIKDLIEKSSLSLVKKQGDNPYRSAHSVVDMLRDITSTQCYFVRNEAVLQKSNELPNLQGIMGTKTFAEVFIAPGKFLVKLNSMDEYWTKVLIIF